jgi:hypothetical protein
VNYSYQLTWKFARKVISLNMQLCLECKSIFGLSIFLSKMSNKHNLSHKSSKIDNDLIKFRFQVNMLQYISYRKTFWPIYERKTNNFMSKVIFPQRLWKEKVILLPRSHNWYTFNNLDWKNYDFPLYMYYLKLKYRLWK